MAQNRKINPTFSLLRIARGLVGGSFLALLALTGCGDSPPSVSQSSETEPQEAETAPPAASAAPESAPGSPSGLVRQDGKKTWIGDVPLDVWYEDPLTVASDAGQVAAPASLPDAAPTPKPEAQPAPMPMTVGGGGGDWKSIISAELLDAEVTAIRNRFTADLQTVGSYNSSYLALPPHAATLAVLAEIAIQHPDAVRWKENAKYVRHLAGQMIAEPLRSGAGFQRPLKEKFENILTILNGSKPATLEEPPADEDVAALAEMRVLMRRLENASKLIKVNGGTAEAMKENAAQLKQEAAVLGALTQILQAEGYGFAEDDAFKAYVKDMVDISKELQENVQTDQFGKFELGVSKMMQACDKCHADYRG